MTELSAQIRVVNARRGAAWWAEGWRLFTPAVLPWMGIVILYMLISIGISAIPYVGDVGHWLLTPVFTAGLMVGCQAVSRGERLRIAHLFEGFQGAHFVPLIIIGAINMAIVLIIAAIATVGVIGGLRITDALRMGAIGDPLGTMSNMAMRIGIGGLLTSLLLLVIAAVFGMLNWFAPALVVLQGEKPLAAMKLSFIACWRNWLAFLVYALVAVALAIVVMIVFGALIFGLGATAWFSDTGSGWSAIVGLIVLLGVLMFVGALIALPVIFGATYAGYRDIFTSGTKERGAVAGYQPQPGALP